MRNNYWSCSIFANWIRGTAKPYSASSKGWRQWRVNAQTAHQFRYWVAEELLDEIQNFLYLPYDLFNNFRWYVRNRWIDQTYALVAHKDHLKRGQWYDVDGRFIPCLFDTLVDFVEQECAHMATWSNDKYKLPWWARINIFLFKGWRSKEAGLENLDWQMSLVYGENDGIKSTNKLFGKPTHQAIAAKEIKALYTWYTDVYWNRPDPSDISGWSAYCDSKRSKSGDVDNLLDSLGEDETKEEKIKFSKILKALNKIEADYEKVETEMMIRLIKIRKSLWT